MTYEAYLTNRFTKIDRFTHKHHRWLEKSGEFYFLGEYTARKRYSYSPTNDVILNFKKPSDRKGKPEWKYKRKAINQISTAFRNALGANLSPSDLSTVVLVPVPPSSAREDPLYDNRIASMVHAIWPDNRANVKEMIVQIGSFEPSHTSHNRPEKKEIESRYEIDEDLVHLPPNTIAIVDDILTTGAHFRAVKSLLEKRFPNARILGLFVARTVQRSSL